MRVDTSRAIAKLDRVQTTPAEPALEEAGAVAEGELRPRTPVLTGALLDSVGTRREGPGRIRTGWGIARYQTDEKMRSVAARTGAVANTLAAAARRMRDAAAQRFKRDARARSGRR